MEEGCMFPARHRITMALLALLALSLGPSAGCGGDDDAGGDGGDSGDGDASPGTDGSVAVCGNGIDLALEPVAGGFAEPILVTSPPGDPRLFVVSRLGAISIVEDGQVLGDPFLDLTDQVV